MVMSFLDFFFTKDLKCRNIMSAFFQLSQKNCHQDPCFQIFFPGKDIFCISIPEGFFQTQSRLFFPALNLLGFSKSFAHFYKKVSCLCCFLECFADRIQFCIPECVGFACPDIFRRQSIGRKKIRQVSPQKASSFFQRFLRIIHDSICTDHASSCLTAVKLCDLVLQLHTVKYCVRRYMYILQGESGYYSALSDVGSSLKAGVFNICSFLDVSFRSDQCCVQSSLAI